MITALRGGASAARSACAATHAALPRRRCRREKSVVFMSEEYDIALSLHAVIAIE
jgi:hypothetical protein